ncbi:hypothetical protein [Amycolatopsis mediterranei]|uniref:hypothetical protein n=1 Tax=Amycolatopsis mediterranei TaxID=33910 RepID=UPI001F15D7D2|nr:hypothetical protein [Amycolatopsis mediterranei]
MAIGVSPDEQNARFRHVDFIIENFADILRAADEIRDLELLRRVLPVCGKLLVHQPALGLVSCSQYSNDRSKQRGGPVHPTTPSGLVEVLVVGVDPAEIRRAHLAGEAGFTVCSQETSHDGARADYDESTGTWTVRVRGGAVMRARFLFAGPGNRLDVRGCGGVPLEKHRARSRFDVAVAGFPNLFFYGGPRAGGRVELVLELLGHARRMGYEIVEADPAATDPAPFSPDENSYFKAGDFQTFEFGRPPRVQGARS